MSSRIWLIALAASLALTVAPRIARWTDAGTKTDHCTADGCGSGACGQLRSLQAWHDARWGTSPSHQRDSAE